MTVKNDDKTPAIYAIHVKNNLDVCWHEWFEGMTITNHENDEVIISGPIVDQSALHGLLMKVGDLNLTLISVKKISP